jgi:hypothetical protein
MSKRALFALAPVLALGLAACGGGFTASGDPVTESEAADLAQGLVQGGFAGFGSFAGAPSRAPSATATNVTITLNDTAPCEGGGTVALNGSMTANVDQSGNSGTFGFNYTVAPSGCQITTGGGKTFTINGDPNLKAQGDFTFSSGTNSETFQGSLSYNGKFKWTSSDGRAGACGVDLTANYNFTFATTATGTATMSGTVCGVTVNRSVSVTP